MATPTTNLYLDGNFNVASGQLGLTVIATLGSSPIDLWTEFPQKPHFYVLDPDGVDRIVRLPLVGTGGNTAIAGHQVFVKNTSSTNTITVQTAGGDPVQVFGAREGGYVVAKSAPNDWTLINVTNESGGATFIGLSDTPAAYAGNANRVLSVNTTPDAVAFSENSVGTTTDPSQNSTTFGKGSSTGTGATAVGTNATATNNSTAIGNDAITRIECTTNMTNGQIMRKSAGTVLTGAGATPNVTDDLNFDRIKLFTTTDIVIGTEEINYELPGTHEYRVRIPPGSCFYLDSFNLIQTVAGTGGGVSSTLAFGEDNTGDFPGFSSISYPDNVAVNTRSNFGFLSDCNNIDTFMYIRVVGKANGGRFRCLWRGVLIENE